VRLFFIKRRRCFAKEKEKKKLDPLFFLKDDDEESSSPFAPARAPSYQRLDPNSHLLDRRADAAKRAGEGRGHFAVWKEG